MSGRVMRTAALASLMSGVLIHQADAQQSPGLASQTELRVCADPSNLPFSNQKTEGFENKIAALIAHDLNLTLSYTWFPDSQGFVRATLMKHRCDVVIGTVAGVDDMAATDAYYHTAYVMLTRKADNITTDKVSDWKLAGRRFGIIAGTPPTNLVVDHNLMDQTAIYPLMVDTRIDAPSHRMVTDIAAGRVDVGMLWGPLAGYYTAHDALPLRLTLLDPEGAKVRLDYHIAMGVRQGDVDFRRRLNAVLSKEKPQIQAILQSYHVPLLDEQNHLIPEDKSATPAQ